MKTRTIRLVRPPATDEPGVLCIVDGNKSSFYAFAEIPCEIGGRAFAIHKLGLGTLYHVRIHGSMDSTCECLGFLSKGRCKHVLGLLALVGHELV